MVPLGMINPPSKKITSSPAEANVFAMIMSRAIEATDLKRPSAIW